MGQRLTQKKQFGHVRATTGESRVSSPAGLARSIAPPRSWTILYRAGVHRIFL